MKSIDNEQLFILNNFRKRISKFILIIQFTFVCILFKRLLKNSLKTYHCLNTEFEYEYKHIF